MHRRLFLSLLVWPVMSVFAADYDLLIKNARIADGTGAPLVAGSVAVKDKHVVAVGDVKGTGTVEMDAQGRVVAPGFIDVHTHSEDIAGKPVSENFLRMGVTTIVTGNCGGSRVDVGKFFEEITKVGVTLNVATLIGHNSVRKEAMGGSFLRRPSPEQLEQMKRLVDQAMKDGAVGLSTGLIYVPGSFAKTDEIVELAKVAAAHGGIYASHMRAETVKIFDAIEELLTVAREAKIRAEVSHIKLSGPTAWGKTAEVIALLDKARAEGLQVTHDLYAYTASSTGLVQLIPDKALDGGHDALLTRLADPAQKADILEEMKKSRERQGHADYGYAVIAKFSPDPTLNGLSIRQAAKLKRGNDSLDDQIELLFDIERQGGGKGVFHGMDEDDVQAFLKHPLTMIASDGGPRTLGEDIPHPRSYGNNARVLARYVRELKVLALPEAVRRMTSLPAQTFHLAGRGVIKPGAWADIVVFDPDKVGDIATFEDPHHYAVGFSDVIVNGTPVIRGGNLTEARSGGPLRMSHMATLASVPPAPPKSVAPQVPATWKAGVASVVVTPQKNLFMAGYAARKKPAEGKVQELFAKALALEDEKGGRMVFVTMDLIGIPQSLRHAVAARAEKEFKLQPAALLLNASHTHCGPSLRAGPVTEEDLKNPRIKDAYEYTQELQDKMVGLIGRALASLEPARLTYNKARCGFAMNRRRDYTLPPDDPNANKAPNPNGPVDHEVPALRIESPDGKLRAVMFGYACHNTSLGFFNYCGDYAGYAQEYLQEHRPDFTAMFLMGCGGDQNPYPRRSEVVPGVSDIELTRQHGRSLANAVEMAISANPRPVTGPIHSSYEEVVLDYAKEGKAPHHYPVQVIKLGESLEFVALGSEVVVDYSLRFKRELGGAAPIWVAGYSNDYTGYIPSLRVLKEGGYEAAAGWAESVEERIAGKVHELHQRLKAAAE